MRKMDLKTKFKRFFTLKRKANNGFTLVELIVVIAILAILGGVAVPAYSGYVKKAERAADEALLNEINKAFVSACMMNGEDNFGRTDVVISGAVGSEFNYTAPFVEDFYSFFEGGAFEVMTVVYDKDAGCFVASDSEFANLFNTLKEMFGDDIANKILASALSTIGTETLFDQMNAAMDLAGELELHKLGGESFYKAYFQYLGIDPSAYDTDEEAQAALDAKLGELGVDDATAATNAIALYAAQNSADLTTDRLSQWLGSDKTTEDLKNSANANTLAETAAIYGMYLSYYKETNGTAPTDPTLDVMTEALTDKGFANWVNDTNGSAQRELDAYKTYMGIVNEAAKDDSARDEILANGFSNPELEDLMKDLIGN